MSELQPSVLLTGVSSFTGYWFAKLLAQSKASVVCPLPRASEAYEGMKKKRLEALPAEVRLVYDAPFGSPRFLEVIEETGQGIDALCLHGSYVSGYNKSTFPVTEAVRQNLFCAEEVLARAHELGCRRVLWTASVFEDAVDLDCPENGSRPVWYRYALSKKISGVVLRALCAENDLGFTRFVVTNPFGPLEDQKLCHHLAKAVFSGATFCVKTPLYHRDMIHVRHLAEAYRNQVTDTLAEKANTGFCEIRPSEFSGELGSFAETFVRELSTRLGCSAQVETAEAPSLEEPLSLLNETHVRTLVRNYDPGSRWDEATCYYKEKFNCN